MHLPMSNQGSTGKFMDNFKHLELKYRSVYQYHPGYNVGILLPLELTNMTQYRIYQG